MSFRRREFPEILDRLLTSIAKGVADETHPFPPQGDEGASVLHRLRKSPVSRIISVYGSVSGNSHCFCEDADYRLSDDGSALEWLDEGDKPDSGTFIHVNYYPKSARPELTDTHVGSVMRTLAESISLEIAAMYAQLEVVYNAGFIDSATGRALENVVSLLGIERINQGRATGDIKFTRSLDSVGTIVIPAGTRVSTEDMSVEYETTTPATLFPGQNTAITTVRDLGFNEAVRANELTRLAVSIAGVARVTNPSPTAISFQGESDAELRSRAKGLMHGSERGTIGAIQNAIARQGVTADIVELDTPGVVEVRTHTANIAPDLMQRLLTAIEESRPAGVVIKLVLPNAFDNKASTHESVDFLTEEHTLKGSLSHIGVDGD